MLLFKIISFLFLVSVVSDSATAALNKRIVNGVTAPVGRYPFMVSLRTANVHFCGGTIVNNNWVLTSATCVTGKTSFQIVVGTNTLNSGGTTYASSTIIKHPSYVFATQIYDAAIVRTATPIVYTATVQPVVLGNLLAIPGAPTVEIGWGQTTLASGSPSNDLLALNTTVISTTVCQTQVNPVAFTLQTTHFCTYKASAASCLLDDGGPLVIGIMQIGIIIAFGCEFNYPDVYTSLQSVYFWVKTNTR